MGNKEEFIEIRELLNKILGIVEGEFRVGKILEKRINALEEKERELLDRVMARSYGEFVLGQDVGKEERIEIVEHPEDALEENAGGILEIKE